MHTVTFIVALIFFVIAAAVFGYALAQLYRGDLRARNTMMTGFGIGLFGVVVAAILFGFFSL